METTEVVVECPTCHKVEKFQVKPNLLYGAGCKICDEMSYGVWRTDSTCKHCNRLELAGHFTIYDGGKVNYVKCIVCKHK